EAMKNAGAVEQGGVWTLTAEKGVTPVPFEQWPDDELTVYMTLSPRSTGEVQIKSACVPPKGYRAAEVSYTYDMGDGTVLNAALSSYTYLQPGTYTIKCTAKVGDYTATVEQTVDMSDIKGDRGFKVRGLCSEMAPQGGGSRNIGVICDGEIPSVVGAQLTQQYDTYSSSTLSKDFFGLGFDHTVTVTEVLFTEGAHFENGGWFTKTPEVEVLIGETWQKVASRCSPLYIEVDGIGAQGDPYQTFTFTLEEPVACRAVRVIGPAGGNAKFVSCAEMDINFSDVENPTYEGIDLSDPVGSAIIIVSESNPGGAGCKDIELIRDGKSASVGSGGNHGTEQYDTFTGRGDDHEEFYGYIFRGEVDVASVTFTEGCHFDNGGWFKDGTLRLELMIDGEWEEADAKISPKYPTGDSMGTFGSNYQSYKFTLDSATMCTGIRVIGMAGGSAHFTSVSELAVEVE
ncbi:MAG: PKD domain-containing protein, partial [Clostridia bacterium]|nr:PKD domain-containing protein [Clostridia bacterium]